MSLLKAAAAALATVAASVLVASAVNDARDLVLVVHGAQVPDCQTFSLVRPRCR